MSLCPLVGGGIIVLNLEKIPVESSLCTCVTLSTILFTLAVQVHTGLSPRLSVITKQVGIRIDNRAAEETFQFIEILFRRLPRLLC